MLPSLQAILDAHAVSEEVRRRLEELDALCPWGTLRADWTEEQLTALDERETRVDDIDKEV